VGHKDFFAGRKPSQGHLPSQDTLHIVCGQQRFFYGPQMAVMKAISNSLLIEIERFLWALSLVRILLIFLLNLEGRKKVLGKDSKKEK
jgi:hypothetical protein